MKLAYPVILTPYEDNSGGFVAEVPDLPGCVTGGSNLAEALIMAEDAASGWVLTELESGKTAPEASDISDIVTENPNSKLSMVALDMDSYAANTVLRQFVKMLLFQLGLTLGRKKLESATVGLCAML